MSRLPRTDGSLGFAETAGIIVIATMGLIMLGLVNLVATAIDALWPRASKIGALHFDPAPLSPPKRPHPPTKG